jgi:hypothetical protein
MFEILIRRLEPFIVPLAPAHSFCPESPHRLSRENEVQKYSLFELELFQFLPFTPLEENKYLCYSPQIHGSARHQGTGRHTKADSTRNDSTSGF